MKKCICKNQNIIHWPLNSYLEKKDASYTWQIVGITFSGCWLERMPTFMKYTWSIQFILWINMNSFLHFLPHLKGLDIRKATSVSGNSEGWKFHQILINITQEHIKDALIKSFFLTSFLHYFYLVLSIKKCLCQFSICYDSQGSSGKWEVIKKFSTIWWDPFKLNSNIIT